MAGRAPVHGVHEDKLSSTWRAPELTWWGANLGWLGCELDIGPKTKFEAHELLFIFHLETKVIRALQQRVIRP